MEKIIYNTKLKKLLVSILVVMILISSVMPNVVFAEKVNELVKDMTGGERMGPYNLVTEEDYKWFFGEERDENNAYAPWILAAKTACFAANTMGTTKDALIQNIANDFDITVEYATDILNNRENVQIWVYASPCSYCNNIGLMGKQYAIQGIRWDVTEEDEENGLTQDVVDGNVSETPIEESADLGGILLSPVFYLINFIADAIISNVGNLMNGNGLSAISGIEVLTENYVPQEAYNSKNFTTQEVEIKSFFEDLRTVGGTIAGKDMKPYQYPNLTYTPEEIFSGKIDLLSIDFITGKNYEGEDNSNAGWLNIRKVISQWYQILRMVAIIGLLSVLIYTGIKIIISANAKDKAKYKEWIMNWFMAVAILFSMHIIMAFIVNVTGEFSKLMTQACQGINVVILKDGAPTGDSFVTNLMGLVRFMIQSENFYIKVGYEVMYIVLIWYTLKFTFAYLKRVLNMAFLTLIAPIVALTYPIDKINDGRAQGFDMWLKEYIFNALLQPMHCILYYVLVGSAVSIAASNPIYGIVVLAFMSEAERLLKKIFGFDKAGGGTVGGMANAFAAGAIASSISKMVKLPKGNAGKGGAGSGSDGEANNILDNVKPLKDNNDDIEKNFNNDLMIDEGNSGNNDTGNRNTENGNTWNGNQSDENEVGGENFEENNGEDGVTRDEKAKRKEAIKNGMKNVGKTMFRPIYDFSRDEKYNKQRWKRRGINALKGVGRAALGVSLGTAAAAVQAGISITDGKYNPMEGIAAFTAGYAGAGKITKGADSMFSNLSNSFKEGYYEGNDEALREKQKEEFMNNDKIFKAYQKKYGEKALDMQKLACDNMLPYGYKETKDQFAIQKMAKEIKDRNNNASMEQCIRQARNTKGFIDSLESQGQKGTIGDPSKQAKYIESIAKSKNISKGSNEYAELEKSYNNAFKSAAVWYQVNKK